MAKQTFTTGQVLTAAQMTSLQQTAMGGGTPVVKTASYVLTAADAGTVIQMNSASSTTITVNTALFSAGDAVWIQNIGAGVCTITAGTATVTTAGSLGLVQWEGGQLYFTSTSASIFFDYIQAGTSIPLTTKGDLFGYDTGNARIPVGANDTVLTADSTQALGVKWAAVAGGGFTSLATGNLSGSSSVSISSIPSGYRQLRLVINAMQSTAGNFAFVFNGDTAANYGANVLKGATTQVNDQNAFSPDQSTPTSALNGSMILDIFEYAAAYQKNFAFYGGRGDSTNQFSAGFGIWNNTAAMTAIRIDNSNNFTAGSYTLYGVK
jgi:hypothetical protein